MYWIRTGGSSRHLVRRHKLALGSWNAAFAQLNLLHQSTGALLTLQRYMKGVSRGVTLMHDFCGMRDRFYRTGCANLKE